MINAEQFAEWKEHPVTKEIYLEIKKAKQNLEQQLSNGQTVGHAADVTHGLTSKVIGQIRGLDQLLNISYVDEEAESDVNESSEY